MCQNYLFDFVKNNILQSESPVFKGDYVEDAISTLSSGTLFGTPYTEEQAVPSYTNHKHDETPVGFYLHN